MRNHYAGPGNVLLTFATPILQRMFENADDLNRALIRIVLAREKTIPSAGRSNVGGWHSNDDLFDWPEPEIVTLRSWVSDAVGEIANVDLDGRIDGNREVKMDGGAWANLCRDGGYNKIHNHPGCSWSGVCHVSTGIEDPDAPPDAGKIEFIDPRMGATCGCGEGQGTQREWNGCVCDCEETENRTGGCLEVVPHCWTVWQRS